MAVTGFVVAGEAKRRFSAFWVVGTVAVVGALGFWCFAIVSGAEDKRTALASATVEEWLQDDYGISTSIEITTGLLDTPQIEGMRVSDGERMLTIVLEGGSSYALVDDDSRVVEPRH